jgi:hypothetical protein
MAIEDEQTEDLNNESLTQNPFEKEGYHTNSAPAPCSIYSVNYNSVNYS